MVIIEKLLATIPDKTEYTATTSHKFKKDIWDFCSNPGFKELKAVELGTSNGHSTHILSYLFDSVTTVNNNESIRAKEFNKDRDNITFLNFDLYRTPWQVYEGDIFFIDADHSYQAVCLDIQHSLKLKSSIEKKVFIFDDYGAEQYKDEVRRAVDEFVSRGKLEVLGYVGHEPGWTVDGTPGRTLTHYEGIICQER